MKEKKVLIFNAVLDIINERGMNSNITISEIAKRAGIGKGTVYEYFKNKDEIIVESILYLLENSNDEIINLGKEAELTFKEELTNLIHRLMTSIGKKEGLYNLFFSQNSCNVIDQHMKMKLIKRIQELRLEFDKRLHSIFLMGISEGVISEELDPFNVSIATTALISTTMHFIHQNQNNIEGKEDEFVEKLYKVIVKILY